MGFIYLRTNKVNGKKYVGQVITKRFKERQRKWNCLKQPYAGPVINRARNKYGIDVFGFEILKECDDKELDFWEKYYIKELNTKVPYGYNMTDGGDGSNGCSPSNETRKKISESNKGKNKGKTPWMKGKKHTIATRKRITESLKGSTPWNKGKNNIYSEETRKKISEGNKGKQHTEEWKKQMSEKMKGRKMSKEWRMKMSEAQKGRKQSEITRKKISESNKGKHRSEELKMKLSTILKNRKDCSKSIIQIDKYTNEIIAEFPSIQEAERKTNYNHSKLCACCKGKSKTAYNYIWRYKESAA